MKAFLKIVLACCAAVGVNAASADATFFEHDNFNGRSFSTRDGQADFRSLGFNDRASSVVVRGEPWEVCQDIQFGGQCFILRPGSYPSLGTMQMNDFLSSARPAGRGRREGRGDGRGDRYAPVPMAGQITLFSQEGFQGRGVSTERDVLNLQQIGFNDRASSVIVLGERWEACEHADFSGRCVILRPGRYADLRSMGLNNQLSSVRALHPAARYDEERYAPPPVPVYDWRRRPEERVYEVAVRDVRAIYAEPQQRCWVEREQVVKQSRGGANVGGAVIGGIVGGILGHQIGSGPNRDIVTVGGAVAGAVIGGNVGRGERTVASQDVQRCAAVPPQGGPEFWDVSYLFHGAEHHVQMTSPPGRTIMVNANGEPRI